MSTRFQRPAGAYTGDLGLSNRSKYQNDSTANPKVAISSTKIDGDFNYLINSLNTLNDEMQGIVLGELPDGSITTAKLANGAVGSNNISAGAVNNAAVEAGAISTAKLASQAVTNTKIASLAVETTHLADGCTTADKIAASAITNTKIANNAVTFSKVQAIATARLLGRSSASSGEIEELSIGAGLGLAGGILSNTQTQVLSTSYTSAEQTVTAASLISVAHGLGSKPKLIMLKLVCKTAEAGYAVGDEVIIADAFTTGSTSLALSTYLDNTTHINVRISSGGVVANNKSTGVTTVLTAANWRLIVLAYA